MRSLAPPGSRLFGRSPGRGAFPVAEARSLKHTFQRNDRRPNFSADTDGRNFSSLRRRVARISAEVEITPTSLRYAERFHFVKAHVLTCLLEPNRSVKYELVLDPAIPFVYICMTNKDPTNHAASPSLRRWTQAARGIPRKHENPDRTRQARVTDRA